MASLVQVSRPGEPDRRTTTSVPSQQGFANIQEDILSQVFLLLSRTYDDEDYDEQYERLGRKKWDWVSVSEVCRYWHAVAIGNPELWSYLDQFYWTKRFQLSMRLSKSAQLTVSFLIMTRNINVELGNLKTALKEIGRIAHLTLVADINGAQATELLPYFELPATRMQTFYLSIPALTLLPRFHLPYTSPGILRKVDLDVITAPSLISGLTRLSDLSLRNCSFPLSSLWGALNASPGLKYLSIASCEIGHSNISILRSAHLPNLEHLSLLFEDSTICFNILQVIEVPNISSWSMISRGRLALEHVTKLNTVSKLLRRDYRPEEMSLGANCFSNNRSFGSMRLAGDRRYLDFDFDQPDRDVILQCWMDIFERHLTGITRLEISTNGYDVSTSTWGRVFGACASVKILKISLSYDGLDEGVSFDARGRRPDIEEIGGSLPGLEHLFVEPYFNLENTDDPERFVSELKDLLERRSTNGLPVFKVTAHSFDAESDCVLHEGLEELGVLRQWAKALLARQRKLEWESESDVRGSESESSEM